MNFIFSILFFYSKFSRTQYEALTKVSSVFSLFKSEPSVLMKIFLSLCSSVFSSKDLHRLNTSLGKSMIQIKFRKQCFGLGRLLFPTFKVVLLEQFINITLTVDDFTFYLDKGN